MTCKGRGECHVSFCVWLWVGKKSGVVISVDMDGRACVYGSKCIQARANEMHVCVCASENRCMGARVVHVYGCVTGCTCLRARAGEPRIENNTKKQERMVIWKESACAWA